MERIVNRNCDGMCCELCCNKEPTHFQIIIKNGVEMILPFCTEHAEIYYTEDIKNGKY